MVRLAGWLLALGAFTAAGQVAAAPALVVSQRTATDLTLRPLSAKAVDEPPGGFKLTLDEAGERTLELEVLWPQAERPSRLRLSGSSRQTDAGPVTHLIAELWLPDGSAPRRAERDLRFTAEPSTALFEVAREGDRVLTLAMEGELRQTSHYSARPTVGLPVRLRLEIEWLEQGTPVTLETNVLSTFVGQSVSYAFELGAPDEAPSASLELRPLQIIGDTVRVAVSLTGTLPGATKGLIAVSRSEEWLSTRGARSSLSLADGEPPTGFRFVVTPEF